MQKPNICVQKPNITPHFRAFYWGFKYANFDRLYLYQH